MGIYQLTVGLETSESELIQTLKAEEARVYNFYVGSSNCFLDVDVEYIYQNGLDILHSYAQPGSGSDDFGYVAAPFVGSTRVQLAHAYSPSNPVPWSRIEYDLDHIRSFRNRYSSFWDTAYQRPQYPYVLCAVDCFVPVGDTVPLVGVLGDARRECGVAMVAAGQIERTFNTEWKNLKLWSASHELSHLVGEGLTDYCEHSTDNSTNTSQKVCLMTAIAAQYPGNMPWYWCAPSQGFKLFDANYGFCDLCKERLNNLDFLFPGGVPKRPKAPVTFVPEKER